MPTHETSGSSASTRPGRGADPRRSAAAGANPDDLLEILAEGLSQAFHDIRADSPPTVTTGDEPEVTALMQARLNRMINEDTLWRQLVNYVARGTDSISFDGSHIEKSPDLSIVLSDAELRFPLVAEAKILDAAMSKTVALYCKAGIRRFVDGEYAWGNREAFMIGYVRDGSSIQYGVDALPCRRPFAVTGCNRSPSLSGPALPTSRIHGMAGTSFIRPSDRQTAPGRFRSGICGWRRRRGPGNRPTPISPAARSRPRRHASQAALVSTGIPQCRKAPSRPQHLRSFRACLRH